MTMPAEPAARTEPNVLKRKIGPLPTWLWVLIVAAIILAWALYRRSQSSSQTASPSGPDQSQVPQFVNQTFVQPGPPGPPDEDNDADDKRLPHEPPPVPPMHPKPPPTRNPPPIRNPRGGKGGPPPHEPPPRHRKRRHAGAGRGT